ncbi:MFS transporter [Neobacillus cucumis]|uniref:MFS transporter n=1 Tax=Neobacillus cucumis TaxID=1740721 RepID=UPI001964E34A|nr:MFS transporter [Neobacillus cucumis]MBM7652430.1 DHA1 family purine base/nucleoside efflux pump-like MFS transporter [Neobacillus cucumis]
MNFKVYLLALVSFVVGLAELIVGGILDIVANGLGVSVSKAGELISIYSFVFAIFSPVLLTVTAKVERKKLFLWTLLIFFSGNILAFVSPNFLVLFISRIISAATGSLLVVLSVTLASTMVKEEFRARAIGVIFMGVSGSLVIGVPIGLVIGHMFGWRSPFLFIAILTLISIMGIMVFLDKMEPRPIITIRKQLETLKKPKILFAQLTSLLFLTGHLTLYAYLTPFLQTSLHLNSTWISVFYFIFGVSAVFGGGLGGFMADKWGSRKSILTIVAVFCLVLFILPKATLSTILFVVVMMVWSMLSWAITPAQQNYLIETTPETADIQQSLNNSAMHFGIAAGSVIGGVVINQYSVYYNATIGGIFVFLALICAIFSITRNQAESRESYETLTKEVKMTN